MAYPVLLKVPIVDNKSHLLLHITPTCSIQPLQITLLATEGSRAFGTILTPTRISSFMHPKFSGSNEDLVSIFLYLLRKIPPGNFDIVEGIEILASVETDFIMVRIRKRIQKFIQQVASFKIPESGVELSIFDWTIDACSALDLANEKLRTNQAQVEEKDKTIEKLLEQLKNMTEMKKEHEELLLTKFQLLLNTKKARIRELDQKLANNTSNEPKSDGEEPNSTLEPAQNRSKGNAKNVSSSTLEPMHTQPKGRRKATVREPAASTHVRRKHKPIPLSSGSEDDGVFITAGKMDIDNDESPKRTLRTTRIENKLPEKRPPPSPTTDDCATSSDVGEAQTSDHKDSEDEELPPVRKPPVIRPSKATVPKPGAWSATTASAGIGNTARAADEFDDDDDDDEL